MKEYIAGMMFRAGYDAVDSNLLLAQKLLSDDTIWTKGGVYSIETPLHPDGASIVAWKSRQDLGHIVVKKIQTTLPLINVTPPPPPPPSGARPSSPHPLHHSRLFVGSSALH